MEAGVISPAVAGQEAPPVFQPGDAITAKLARAVRVGATIMDTPLPTRSRHLGGMDATGSSTAANTMGFHQARARPAQGKSDKNPT
jgi:hypothetical protein